MTLPMAIQRAVAEFPGGGNLCWKYLPINLDARTAPCGYALYCRTGIRENGVSIERRLWCGDIARARQIADELGMRDSLDRLNEAIEMEDARRSPTARWRNF